MVSTNLSKSSLTKLTFDPTRAGIKVFKLKFRVAIGTTLAKVLKDAQTNDHYEPTDSKDLKAHGEIFDYLISTMTDDVLILEMVTECGELGPSCLKFLNDKYDPASTATSLKTLLNLMKAPLGDDISSGISAAVVSNSNLPTGLQFPDMGQAPLRPHAPQAAYEIQQPQVHHRRARRAPDGRATQGQGHQLDRHV